MSSAPDASRPASYAEAVAAFIAAGSAWSRLPFFASGEAAKVAAKVDARLAAGADVWPKPADLFNALAATPLDQVKAVILGQDPYPTPGNAHGFAFSVQPGQRVPASLRNIFREMASDLSLPPPRSGSLEPWARHGVLLLNTCLTVEAGSAGSHRRLGWERLTDEVIAAVAAIEHPVVFILWGNDARKRRALVHPHHGIIEAPHPSPLSAHAGFFGSRPFSRANDWLEANGAKPVTWRLT